jgi:hypothetical protein
MWLITPEFVFYVAQVETTYIHVMSQRHNETADRQWRGSRSCL